MRGDEPRMTIAQAHLHFLQHNSSSSPHRTSDEEKLEPRPSASSYYPPFPATSSSASSPNPSRLPRELVSTPPRSPLHSPFLDVWVRDRVSPRSIKPSIPSSNPTTAAEAPSLESLHSSHRIASLCSAHREIPSPPPETCPTTLAAFVIFLIAALTRLRASKSSICCNPPRERRPTTAPRRAYVSRSRAHRVPLTNHLATNIRALPPRKPR